MIKSDSVWMNATTDQVSFATRHQVFAGFVFATSFFFPSVLLLCLFASASSHFVRSAIGIFAAVAVVVVVVAVVVAVAVVVVARKSDGSF